MMSDPIVTTLEEMTSQVGLNVARPIELRVTRVRRCVYDLVAKPAPEALVERIEEIVVGNQRVGRVHFLEVPFKLFLVVETFFAAVQAVTEEDVLYCAMFVLFVIGPVDVFGKCLVA